MQTLPDFFQSKKLKMSVIGIDFGNVDCVIAQAKRGGIDIILNENSNRKNPYVNNSDFMTKQYLDSFLLLLIEIWFVSKENSDLSARQPLVWYAYFI